MSPGVFPDRNEGAKQQSIRHRLHLIHLIVHFCCFLSCPLFSCRQFCCRPSFYHSSANILIEQCLGRQTWSYLQTILGPRRLSHSGNSLDQQQNQTPRKLAHDPDWRSATHKRQCNFEPRKNWRDSKERPERRTAEGAGTGGCGDFKESGMAMDTAPAPAASKEEEVDALQQREADGSPGWPKMRFDGANGSTDSIGG